MRPIWRASSRAGFAAPSTFGWHASRRTRELLLRAHELRVRARREPAAEQRDGERRDERADRGARQEPVGAAAGAGRGARARARSSSPPREIATSRAPHSRRRGRHRHRLLGVTRVRHRERERAAVRRTPGTRYCFSTVTGTGSSSLNAAAMTSPEMPEPPMPSTTMLLTSSTRGKRSACTVARGLVRGRELLGQPADRVEEVQRVGRHAATRTRRRSA